LWTLLVIKQRLDELGFEQKIWRPPRSYGVLYFTVAGSQETAPAPDRTDIYEKMAKFLKLRAIGFEAGRHQRRENEENLETLPPLVLEKFGN